MALKLPLSYLLPPTSYLAQTYPISFKNTVFACNITGYCQTCNVHVIICKRFTPHHFFASLLTFLAALALILASKFSQDEKSGVVNLPSPLPARSVVQYRRAKTVLLLLNPFNRHPNLLSSYITFITSSLLGMAKLSDANNCWYTRQRLHSHPIAHSFSLSPLTLSLKETQQSACSGRRTRRGECRMSNTLRYGRLMFQSYPVQINWDFKYFKVCFIQN